MFASVRPGCVPCGGGGGGGGGGGAGFVSIASTCHHANNVVMAMNY